MDKIDFDEIEMLYWKNHSEQIPSRFYDRLKEHGYLVPSQNLNSFTWSPDCEFIEQRYKKFKNPPVTFWRKMLDVLWGR